MTSTATETIFTLKMATIAPTAITMLKAAIKYILITIPLPPMDHAFE